jgi:hypothetical protein
MPRFQQLVKDFPVHCSLTLACKSHLYHLSYHSAEFHNTVNMVLCVTHVCMHFRVVMSELNRELTSKVFQIVTDQGAVLAFLSQFCEIYVP